MPLDDVQALCGTRRPRSTTATRRTRSAPAVARRAARAASGQPAAPAAAHGAEPCVPSARFGAGSSGAARSRARPGRQAEALARATADAQTEPPVGKPRPRKRARGRHPQAARALEGTRPHRCGRPTLWQRFDAALTMSAYGPVAQRAAMKAAPGEPSPRARRCSHAGRRINRRGHATRRLACAAGIFGCGVAQARAARAHRPWRCRLLRCGNAQPRRQATSRRRWPRRAPAQREREALVEQAETLASQDVRDAMTQLRPLRPVAAAPATCRWRAPRRVGAVGALSPGRRCRRVARREAAQQDPQPAEPRPSHRRASVCCDWP